MFSGLRVYWFVAACLWLLRFVSVVDLFVACGLLLLLGFCLFYFGLTFAVYVFMFCFFVFLLWYVYFGLLLVGLLGGCLLVVVNSVVYVMMLFIVAF